MSNTEKIGANAPEFSKLLIIGAGMSGISTAAYYKRRYGDDDYVIYERQKKLGGTWWMNNYPGCGVDTATLLYSFSFYPKYDWSKFFASQPELLEYVNDTAVKLGITSRIRFSTDVEACEWIEEAKRWRVHLRRRRVDKPWALDEPTQEEDAQLEEADRWVHECLVLISCVGALREPKDCNIPGHGNFQGTLFHSARWDHRVDLRGKDVIVVGNGCSAAQIVPTITPITKSTTQFMRSAQWIIPRPSPPLFDDNTAFAKYRRYILCWIPGLNLSLRLWAFMVNEAVFLMFRKTKFGNYLRAAKEKELLEYMRAGCPEKYYDLVLPKYPLGCKRRVLNDGYLSNLHRDNMLLTNDPISHIEENAVVTASGKKYHADVIVMCDGYKPGLSAIPFRLTGKNGQTLEEHFEALGGVGAYKTCAFNGFPNFFVTCGPNSVTGHTSLLIASEVVTDLAMKVAKPVFKGQAEEVEVTRKAEMEYRKFIDDGHKQTVWQTNFCTSWYMDKHGRNTSLYPYSQTHMVLDCMFYSQKDWNIRYTPKALCRSRMVKIACLSILLGLAFQGMRQPKGYFGELWGRALRSLSSVSQILTQCASSVLSQGALFVRGLAGSRAN